MDEMAKGMGKTSDYCGEHEGGEMTIEQELQNWLNTNGLNEEWHDTHNACDYAEAAFLAGAEAQRKRDVEIAMECARTAPKSIGRDHGRRYSAGCQRVARIIEKGEG